MTDQYTLQDPATQYPGPEFETQQQPAPGLAKDMTDPKPDHGERTYRGTGRLTGPKAIVTGADSGIGRAVAIAFAREGADVVLSYLPAEEEHAREGVPVLGRSWRSSRRPGARPSPCPGTCATNRRAPRWSPRPSRISAGSTS